MGHGVQTRITNLVQQAQNKRLSVDLLKRKTLKMVCEHLQDQAETQKIGTSHLQTIGSVANQHFLSPHQPDSCPDSTCTNGFR